MTVLTILNSPGTDVPNLLTDLGDRPGVELRIVSADGLAEALAGTEVLLLWDFFSTALQEAFGRADCLRWIHAASAGVDSLLFDELAASDVVVTNARGTFDRPIAEFVLGFMLVHAKDMLGSAADQRDRRWNRRSTRDVAGTRAMIVGTGSIGREIARVLASVGVEVIGAGSRARDGDADFGEVIDSATLADHLGGIDWLIDIAPLTPATRGLIDAKVLAALGPAGFLINVGRGASVDTDALVTALRDGVIAGAALDVVDPEPLRSDHPLWDLDSVIITPHMSGDTDGWRMRLARQFADLFDADARGEAFTHTVDKRAGYVR